MKNGKNQIDFPLFHHHFSEERSKKKRRRKESITSFLRVVSSQ